MSTLKLVVSNKTDLRQAVIDQLARIGKQLNPSFDAGRFKQECAK